MLVDRKLLWNIVVVVGVAVVVDGCGGVTQSYKAGSNVKVEEKTDADDLIANERDANRRGRNQPADQNQEEPLGDIVADSDSLAEEDATQTPAPDETPPRLTDHDVLKGLPQGSDQLQVICSRPKTDVIRTSLCGPNPPAITSLVELQRVLGLEFTNRNNPGRGNNGQGGNPSFVLTGHSSSLVARFTTAINPRAIIFSSANQRAADPDFVAMGFLRGDQFAEVISRDPNTGELSFFLVAFEQACNARPGGCSNGELLSPAVESNWTKVSIYEDEDLKNTILDCRQCHQPGGPGTAKILRMQELRDPWTHFFRDNRDGGQALIADYQLAHDLDEDYAGIPGSHITSSDPQELENLVRGNGFNNDNIDFDAPNIRNEVVASSPNQPEDNSLPGQSATWQAAYDRSVRGEIIAIPYHDVKVSDQGKLEAMAQSYRSMMAGALDMNELPDIRKTFKEDRNIGFQVAEGLDGRGILIQACRQCHNSDLDQSLSRARFNMDEFDAMSREEKELAIARLKLPPDDLRAMPPRLFRDLSDAERNRAIEELQK